MFVLLLLVIAFLWGLAISLSNYREAYRARSGDEINGARISFFQFYEDYSKDPNKYELASYYPYIEERGRDNLRIKFNYLGWKLYTIWRRYKLRCEKKQDIMNKDMEETDRFYKTKG